MKLLFDPMHSKSYLVLLAFLVHSILAEKPSFSIDEATGTFSKDGKLFKYVSGSFHYFRIPQMFWVDRLLKYKAAGLDAIQIYIPWNYHEPVAGTFDFGDEKDVTVLLTLAKQLDLLVIARPGPYICAEWDFGGLPAWLLKENPTMKLRSSDPSYMKFVNRYWSKLFWLLRTFLYENGGPIIMTQIENEYGSYSTCDGEYMTSLVQKARQILGDKALLFTTDGNGQGMVNCGRIPQKLEANNNLITVDFGAVNDPAQAFVMLDKMQPKKPLVNSENYFGWLEHWGEHRTMMSDNEIKSLARIYSFSNRSSVNIYMFHGGTNFGLTNGANAWKYQPQITSYDYGAPLNENGDLTWNYMNLRKAIHTMKSIPLPSLPKEVHNITANNLPTLTLSL
ncbi:Beta-galactosidase-1-like protein, partial [Cichlidogyrus casuarinus]